MARRAPGEMVRRADEAITRRIPQLASSKLRKRFRKRTVALLAMLGLMAIVASGWAVLRETTLLREAMESQLSERFGGEIRIKSVRWNGWNRITAKNLELRARGWKGPGATIASIRRAEVAFSPWSLLAGRVELVDMEIDGLTLRLIERRDRPGEFSFLSLTPKSGGGTAIRQPDQALLKDIRLEFGTATDTTLDLTATQQFAADFAHSPDDPTSYTFRLEQEEQDGKRVTDNVIRLFGTWNERTFTYEATLDALSIDDALRRMLPAKAQRWAARSGLTGRVERARIEGSPSQPLRAVDIQLRDVTLRERDAVQELQWARLEGSEVVPISGELRVTLGEASVTLRGNELKVEARKATLRPGSAGVDSLAVPLEISARCDLASIGGIEGALDADDKWLARSIATAAYQLDLRIPHVDARTSADGTPKRVELPIEAVRALAAMGAQNWAADISLSIHRDAGSRDKAGNPTSSPIIVRGALELLEGSLKSAAFPYPMTSVKGTIELGNDRLFLRKVSGRGVLDTSFLIDGEIELTGNDPGYSLKLAGRDVQLEQQLVSSVREAPARIFKALLNDNAWKALNAVGILDESAQPGGVLDINLNVLHPRDGGERVEVTGDIDLHGVRVVLETFPFPMTAVGKIEVLDERVNFLGHGVDITTPAGGVGVVSGHLELPRAGKTRLVRTFVEFQVENEPVSRALLAAIPPSFEDSTKRPAGWPGATFSPISEILTELGLGGKLSATGSVRTRQDESDAVTVNVQLSEGVIRPTASLAGVLRENGLSWPGRMNLDNVRSQIIADAGRVSVRNASATHGTGRVQASGSFEVEGKGGTLQIFADDLPLERDLILIADGPAIDRALEAWDALLPTGTLSAEVAWNRTNRSQDIYAHVRPKTLFIAQAVELTPHCGDLYFRNGELRLESIDLRAADTDETPIQIEGSGVILGSHPDFHATVQNLSIGSPLVAQALKASRATAAEDVIDSWSLRGDFDARIQLPAIDSNNPWEVVIEPSWLSGTHNNRYFELNRWSGAIVVGPNGLLVDRLRMLLDHGFIEVAGALASSDSKILLGDLHISALMAGSTNGLQALMPNSAHQALESIDFQATGPVWTDDVRIGIDIPRSGSDGISIDGSLGISAGKFKTGVAFDNIDGTLEFGILTSGGQPSGAIGLSFDQVNAVGRRASNVTGHILFASDTQVVRLEDLTASMYGGKIQASAHIDPSADWTLHLSCANIGFARFVAAGADPSASAASDTKSAKMPAPQPTGGDGFLRGRIDLHGVISDPLARRGSGKAAVTDAQLMEFPLGMSLLQLTQLTLPLNASLETADADFELDGTKILLNKFDLACGTLRLEGSGSVSTSDNALALRFRSRGKLPLLSDIYGVITDQFFAIDVGGTLSNPEPKLTPIPVFAPAPAPTVSVSPKPTVETHTESPVTETR